MLDKFADLEDLIEIFKKLNTIFHKVEGQEDLTEIFPRRRNITKLRKTHS